MTRYFSMLARLTGILLTGIFAGSLPALSAESEKADVVLPTVQWNGTGQGKEPLPLLPGGPEEISGSVITSQEALASLWKRWAAPGDAPRVNFKTHFVLVFTKAGMGLDVRLTRKSGGDLRAEVVPHTKGLDTFAYAILAVSREDIKTLHGKEIAAGVPEFPPLLYLGKPIPPGSQRQDPNQRQQPEKAAP